MNRIAAMDGTKFDKAVTLWYDRRHDTKTAEEGRA
jgi:hypothetical protein